MLMQSLTNTVTIFALSIRSCNTWGCSQKVHLGKRKNKKTCSLHLCLFAASSSLSLQCLMTNILLTRCAWIKSWSAAVHLTALKRHTVILMKHLRDTEYSQTHSETKQRIIRQDWKCSWPKPTQVQQEHQYQQLYDVPPISRQLQLGKKAINVITETEWLFTQTRPAQIMGHIPVTRARWTLEDI